MHLVEASVQRKKRRCRTSKKKRIRLKKRSSLEPKIEIKDDEITSNDDEDEIHEHSQNQDKPQDYGTAEELQQQQVEVATHQDHSLKHSEVLVEAQVPDKKQHHSEDEESEEDDDMTEYERKRRENILRNQAYMKEVGMSIAKLAARTTIGDEAEKEAKRQRLAEKRALRAAQQPKPVQQRHSLRIRMKPYSENVRARARLMESMGVEVSLPVMKAPSASQEMMHQKSVQARHKHEQVNVEQETTAGYSANRNTTETEGRKQEPDTSTFFELQAARRDEFVNRVARMIRKPVNKTANVKSTNFPFIDAMRQPSGDTQVQLQQRVKASPHPAVDPVKNLGFKKQSIGQCNKPNHHDGKDEHDELTGYECKSRKNILRNQTLTQQVGMFAPKFAARMTTWNEAEQEATRQIITAIKRAPLNTDGDDVLLSKRPVRKSRRLGYEPEVELNVLDRGHPLDLLCLKTKRQRHNNKVHFMDAMDEEAKGFLENLTTHFEMPVALEEIAPLIDYDPVEYFLANKDVAKVTPDPIRALSFLPRADRIVIASGDKEGHIALWSPTSAADSSSSAVLYRPHGFAVSQLLFPDATSLISSSYDGTVREFDLWTSTLSVVCDTGFGISALAASGNPQFYYAGCDDGTLRLIDRRARKLDKLGYRLHEARINTLDQHPCLDYCVATASQDNTVCLWDKRRISPKLNIPLATLSHGNTVDCAYFSPHTGAWLATVSQDSFINIYDTSVLSTRKNSGPLPIQLPSPVRIQHNNYMGSAGSKFALHAAWDPKRTNQFVLGCMEKPPRVQIFTAGRHQTVRELTSSNFDTISQVNVFHPHLDIIASAGGRVSLWRGKPKE